MHHARASVHQRTQWNLAIAARYGDMLANQQPVGPGAALNRCRFF
jgi:hypothetical protein